LNGANSAYGSRGAPGALNLEKFYEKLETEGDIRYQRSMELADHFMDKENEDCTFTPALNEASRGMVERQEPLHRRYQSELDKKARGIKEAMRQKEEREL
jgi:hypothetical protein